ncbi:hypothetical protein M378DRAFT_86816, partial [Amanita muscaria Koide BX008]
KKHNAFLLGDTSTCRTHIHQHYELYSARCKKDDILENHFAILCDIWKRMEAEC